MPCINPNHFTDNYDIPGTLHPEVVGFTQFTRNGTVSKPGVSKTYTATAGVKDVLIDIDQVLNMAAPACPFSRRVLCLVSLGSSMIEWRSRTEGSINVEFGASVGVAPAVPPMTVASTFGGGANLGMDGVNVKYAMWSDRVPPITTAHQYIVDLPPGMNLRVVARAYVTHDNWDTTNISGGNTEIVNRVEVGDLQVAIYSCPVPAAFP